jgi:hypothetical protein
VNEEKGRRLAVSVAAAGKGGKKEKKNEDRCAVA